MVGAPGLIVAAIILLSLRDPRPAASTPTRPSELRPNIATILRRPGFTQLLIATACSMAIVGSVTAWLPAYFIRVYGLETRQMGLYGALAIGVGGGLGTLSGLMCERLRNRLVMPESIAMLASLTLVIPALLLVVTSDGKATALAGYFLLNFCAFVWLAPTTRLIQDAVEPQQRALATALCSAAGFMVSLALIVPFIGWASDMPSWRRATRRLPRCSARSGSPNSRSTTTRRHRVPGRCEGVRGPLRCPPRSGDPLQFGAACQRFAHRVGIAAGPQESRQ